RAGEQHKGPEDDALVDAHVAREGGARIALPEVAERLPGAAGEARVRRDPDRDVEVEDPLREALVRVVRRDEEDERERRRDKDERGDREHGKGDAGEATPRPDGRSRWVTRRRHTRTTPSRSLRTRRRRGRGSRGSGPASQRRLRRRRRP